MLIDNDIMFSDVSENVDGTIEIGIELGDCSSFHTPRTVGTPFSLSVQGFVRINTYA